MSNVQECPICGESTLSPTEHSFPMGDILKMWENLTPYRFRESVWKTYGDQHVTLNHCTNCDFSIYDPALAGTSDFYADAVDVDYNYYNDDKWEFRQALKDIGMMDAQKILDVGCGSGSFLESLRRSLNLPTAWGYEISPALARVVTRKGFQVYSDIFPDQLIDDNKANFFDVICIFQVLEHVDDPMRMLRDIKELLASNGKIIIAVPDIDGPVGKYYKFSHMNMPPHHVSHWNSSVIEHAAKRIGMRVEKISYEPLSDYLWSSYLSLIIDDWARWGPIKKLIRVLRIRKSLIYVLKRLNITEIRWLPGHSVYAVLSNELKVMSDA